jgi:hypothetical protein
VAKSGEPVRGGDVYIGLSQESSCWAKIQNPDKVQGGAGQCPAGTLYELGAFSGRVRQYCLAGGFCLWMDLKRTWNRSTQLFSLHPTCPS